MKFKLPDWLYDVIKYLCLIGLPVLNTMLLGIASIWELNLPMDKITQTITVIATALGGWLCIESINYYKEKSSDEYIPEDDESKTL